MKLLNILVLFAILPGFISCKNNEPEQSVSDYDQEGTYFSLKQYFDDQWNIRKNSPYTILRTVTLNHTTDTTFIVLTDTLWQQLRSYFDGADISDPKFLGQYKFNIFNNEETETTNLYYEAKTPSLFTQKIDVGADEITGVVQSIYVETHKKAGVLTKTQKLYYKPDHIFQIQEFEKSIGLPSKNLIMEFRFKY